MGIKPKIPDFQKMVNGMGNGKVFCPCHNSSVPAIGLNKYIFQNNRKVREIHCKSVS